MTSSHIYANGKQPFISRCATHTHTHTSAANDWETLKILFNISLHVGQSGVPPRDMCSGKDDRGGLERIQLDQLITARPRVDEQLVLQSQVAAICRYIYIFFDYRILKKKKKEWREESRYILCFLHDAHVRSGQSYGADAAEYVMQFRVRHEIRGDLVHIHIQTSREPGPAETGSSRLYDKFKSRRGAPDLITWSSAAACSR